jgi:hypothetical protein
VISSTLNWRHGCPVDLSAVRQDDVEIAGAAAEIGQVSAAMCLTGKSGGWWLFALSSPLCKNISVFPKYKSGYMICHPVPQRGVGHRH